MKRFFDIPSDRLTLQIEVNSLGMEYSIEQIEKATGVSGLREVDRSEYKKLSKEYEV